jgi:hypothetical protein
VPLSYNAARASGKAGTQADGHQEARMLSRIDASPKLARRGGARAAIEDCEPAELRDRP